MGLSCRLGYVVLLAATALSSVAIALERGGNSTLPGDECGPDNATCGTEPLHAPVFQPSSLIRVVILVLIGVLSLVGNCATLVSIWRTRLRARSTVYLLLAHLSVADLLVTFFCVLAEAAWTWTVQWTAGNGACKAVKFLQMFSLYLSTFILVVIAFDRFAAIRFPMRRASARRTVVRMVFGVWALSAMLSLPQGILSGVWLAKRACQALFLRLVRALALHVPPIDQTLRRALVPERALCPLGAAALTLTDTGLYPCQTG
ncbi:hypothetical protein HPB47_011032 [Ixodes persulcatus]|uniref:Uncharacterized protein n=1 Tax=Ixodes persulcatus TaxID=34615 RepID=A0AC60NXH4_IXOPE|nr:hypothetical protein HPB47_011032 [Ixodes persulcatus]